MAQAKKKKSIKTAKKTTAKCCKPAQKKRLCYEKYEKGQPSNMIFVISMSVLAATLLFADILFMTA